MITTRLRTAVVGTAALALALSACSSSDDGSETTEPTGNETTGAAEEGDADGLLATVDTMFGAVEIPEPADGELTVVALGWSDAETALALGVKPVAVFDWMGFGEETHGVGAWASDLFEGEEPVVIPNVDQTVDYELVQSLEPDLILNVRSANDEEQFNQLSSIAPTVFGPEGAPAYATTWRDHTRMIAEALGQAEEGEGLIAEVEAQIETAQADHPEFSELTAVTGSKFGDAYGASMPGDTRWDLLAELGFTLDDEIAALDASGGFYAPVAIEQISVFEADVAVLFPIGYTRDELENDPLIASLDVVREGRTVFLEPDGELSEAFSAASILSVPIAVDGIVPPLADAASNVG